MLIIGGIVAFVVLLLASSSLRYNRPRERDRGALHA